VAVSKTVNGQLTAEASKASDRAAAPVIPRRSLHDEVTDRLRDMIVEGKLAAGERVNEAVLCEEFGVSRTPLREALKVLASEGLVNLLPRRGARVASLDAREICEVFEVLSSLEGTAAELAAGRMTATDLARLRQLQERIQQHHQARRRHEYFRQNHALHQAIVALSGNMVLEETHARLLARVRRARYMAILSEERWEESVREHAEILAALETGNARLAGTLMHRHVARTGEMVCSTLKAETDSRSGAARRRPRPMAEHEESHPSDLGSPHRLPSGSSPQTE
jgi:DNA-binding GntR family transcriptional regulator